MLYRRHDKLSAIIANTAGRWLSKLPSRGQIRGCTETSVTSYTAGLKAYKCNYYGARFCLSLSLSLSLVHIFINHNL